MKQFRALYTLAFISIIMIVFVCGGISQFLFGFSNTVITFLIMCFTLLIYIIYSFLKGKLFFNWIVILSITYAIWCLVSGFINDTEPIKIVTYLIFPLLPLGIILFSYINYKENIISSKNILFYFFVIAILQLPVLLIQKNFYYELIPYNNSGQLIDWYDFMFGTFFLKSDHSLGFFLLLIIAAILLNKENIKSRLYWPKFSILYLSITVFLTESNISKFFLVIILFFSILFPLYHRYKSDFRFKTLGLAVIAILVIIGYNIRDEQFIEDRFGGSLARQFAKENALKQYKSEKAKRYQIVIVALNYQDLKWIGDGPYNYFDITTGRFKSTKHFSQLIWSYYDLGIIGLMLVVINIYLIVSYLEIDVGWPRILFFGSILIYSLYNIIFADLAILISMITIFNKKKNEIYHNPIS